MNCNKNKLTLLLINNSIILTKYQRRKIPVVIAGVHSCSPVAPHRKVFVGTVLPLFEVLGGISPEPAFKKL